MGRASRRKDKRHERARRPERQIITSKPSRIHRVRTIAASLLAAITAYATIFGFILPRLSVEPFIDMDTRDPYKQIFKVTNQGNLDLHKVAYYCKIKGAWIDGRTAPITIVNDENEWFEVAPVVKGETFRTLAPSETDSLSCQVFDEPIPFMMKDRREIAIVVSYRPAYFPFRLERQLGYQLRTSGNGTYHWVPIATHRE